MLAYLMDQLQFLCQIFGKANKEHISIIHMAVLLYSCGCAAQNFFTWCSIDIFFVKVGAKIAQMHSRQIDWMATLGLQRVSMFTLFKKTLIYEQNTKCNKTNLSK